MSEQAPTILIGLGGIGSQIANKVYGAVPEENRKNVAIHAFDTDVSSLKKLVHIEKHVTQTSSRRTVGEYLHHYPSLTKWFPNEHPELLKKGMTQGAGQVRAVSRLAFMSAIEEGKLNQVLDDIEAIFPVSSGKYEQGVRIIVITTLAGGTGSGIFLQIALYLRKVLQERFGERVLVRGAFMLPDVLTRTKVLDQTEWDSVRANGYACIKELEAIRHSVQNPNNNGVTIDLEYRPNQVDIHNRVEHAITEKPYDFAFLYDYENTKTEHLPRLADYMDQMARSIYLQLFSPISERHFSQEDNQIKQLIDSEGKGIYCGSGVATLTYPYEEILEYCALNWSVMGLDHNWLKLDELYEEEKRQYEEDLRNGIKRVKIEKGKSYLHHLRQLGDDRSNDPNPFFREMLNQVHILLEENQRGMPKSVAFLNALEEHIVQTLNTDQELLLKRESSKIDETYLSKRESAGREIENIESNLMIYRDLIENKVYEFRTMITHQAMFQDFDAEGKVKGNHYSLNTWILKEGGPLHPVSTRFFLYETRKLLKEKLGELRGQNEELRQKIHRYDEVYDDKDTEVVETAEMRLQNTLNQGIFGRLFNNKFKAFIKDYVVNSSSQLQRLNLYQKTLLTELVFQSVLENLQQLIAIYEKFFENLKDARVNLQTSIHQKAVQFEETADPTKKYILATKELQHKLWERIRDAETDDIIPSDIAREIYVNMYEQFYKTTKKQFEARQPFDVEEFYREHVVGYCFQKLKQNPVVDINYDAISALRKEAEFLGVHPERYIEQEIQKLDYLALPFIPSMHERRELKFWGIHEENKKQLSEATFTKLFEEDAIIDNAFSKYEITCYRAHYGLEAHHFRKFSNGANSRNHHRQPGVYYQAYYKTINKLNQNEPTVTPHLDKNWHLPVYMQDINPTHVELDKQKINRAFLLGLIYDWFQVVSDQGRYLFAYRGDGNTRIIVQGGNPIEHELKALHQALFYNPAIYDEIIQLAEKERETGKKIRNLSEHKFIIGAQKLSDLKFKNMNNIIDVMVHYIREAVGNPELEVRVHQLIEQLVLEINNYYRVMYGSQKIIAKEKAQSFIKSLWQQSILKEELGKDSLLYSKIESQLFKKRKQPVLG